MTGFAEDDEIFEIVVRRIPVDVVDIERRIRITTETDRVFVFETPSSVCRGHIG